MGGRYGHGSHESGAGQGWQIVLNVHRRARVRHVFPPRMVTSRSEMLSAAIWPVV